MRIWIEGLISAAAGGASSSLPAMYLDPEHFNTSNLPRLGTMAGLGAAIAVAAYLKQRPLPAAVSQPAAKPGD